MIPTGAALVDDPDELAEFFADQPAVHIYALADLDPPYWSGSTWFRRNDAVVGVVRLPDGEGVATYAVSTRDPGGTRTLLSEILPSLPAGQLVTAPLGASNDLTERDAAWSGLHVRYELTNPEALPPSPLVELLGIDDLDDVLALYRREPGAAFFLPHMLGSDTFVGVREAGTLVAIAGTHVVSPLRGVAAIGGVYTSPEYRGRGLAAQTTAGVIRRLPAQIEVVGLNVSASNDAAQRVYERIGFEAILEYEEFELV